MPIVDDTAPEKVEGFYVNLSAPVNATLNATKKQATVAIFDKDVAAGAGLLAAQGSGGRGGQQRHGQRPVPDHALTGSDRERRVDWRTGSFTATLTDYESANGTVTFAAGQTTKTVSVNVKGDRSRRAERGLRPDSRKPRRRDASPPAGRFGVITDDDGPKVGIGRPVARGKSLVMLVTCPKTADLLQREASQPRSGR